MACGDDGGGVATMVSTRPTSWRHHPGNTPPVAARRPPGGPPPPAWPSSGRAASRPGGQAPAAPPGGPAQPAPASRRWPARRRRPAPASGPRRSRAGATRAGAAGAGGRGTGGPLELAAHAALDRVDQVGPQRGGGDDPVHRPDLLGALDAVDVVELLGDPAELLVTDLAGQLAQARPQRRLAPRR